MPRHFFRSVGALAFLVAVAVPASVTTQSSVSPKPAARAKWAPPRAADGQPDLQGVWTNATITPFERPPELAGKPFLNEAEALEIEKQTATERAAADRGTRPGDVGNYNQFWFDNGTKVVSTRQTSLVVEPADGRVPVKAEAEAIRDFNAVHNGDSYEYMSRWDRCITRGVPGSMFPAGYNNAYQIIQTPGYVVILYEMIHDTRVIPLDGRPHVGPNIRLWMGDSRGRWDGDTLVVDTTNFTDKGWIASHAAAGRIKGIPQSDALHVVERFTPVNPDTIQYEVTIEDQKMYSRPWKVAIPLTRDSKYQIYEYACHEGNYAVPNILSGARVLEQGPHP